MKRILLAFAFVVLSGVLAFSQETENFPQDGTSVSAASETGNVSSVSNSKPSMTKGRNLVTMKAGGFFSFEPVLGSLSDYISMNLGGGAGYELGFNILPSLDVGGSFHAAANACVPKKENADLLDYVWNMKFYLGGFARIPFGKSGFAFQPEFDWGFVFYFPKASENYVNHLGSFYADQILQIAASFRYASPMLFENKLELELSPLYSLSPEKDSAVRVLGFRLGALYRFM